jgi:hypothetical protein
MMFDKQPTLQEYFDANPSADHALRVEKLPDGRHKFYIHPNGVNGDTLDFVVRGRETECVGGYQLPPAEGAPLADAGREI